MSYFLLFYQKENAFPNQIRNETKNAEANNKHDSDGQKNNARKTPCTVKQRHLPEKISRDTNNACEKSNKMSYKYFFISHS